MSQHNDWDDGSGSGGDLPVRSGLRVRPSPPQEDEMSERTHVRDVDAALMTLSENGFSRLADVLRKYITEQSADIRRLGDALILARRYGAMNVKPIVDEALESVGRQP